MEKIGRDVEILKRINQIPDDVLDLNVAFLRIEEIFQSLKATFETEEILGIPASFGSMKNPLKREFVSKHIRHKFVKSEL